MKIDRIRHQILKMLGCSIGIINCDRIPQFNFQSHLIELYIVIRVGVNSDRKMWMVLGSTYSFVDNYNIKRLFLDKKDTAKDAM